MVNQEDQKSLIKFEGAGELLSELIHQIKKLWEDGRSLGGASNIRMGMTVSFTELVSEAEKLLLY